MDLSKVFSTINHELLVTKLHAYGFFIEVLEILQLLVHGLSYFKEFHKD